MDTQEIFAEKMKWGRWYSDKIPSDCKAQIDSRMTYWLLGSGVNRSILTME